MHGLPLKTMSVVRIGVIRQYFWRITSRLRYIMFGKATLVITTHRRIFVCVLLCICFQHKCVMWQNRLWMISTQPSFGLWFCTYSTYEKGQMHKASPPEQKGGHSGRRHFQMHFLEWNFVFWLKFRWRFFLSVQLEISDHSAPSHYMTHICGTRGEELIFWPCVGYDPSLFTKYCITHWKVLKVKNRRVWIYQEMSFRTQIKRSVCETVNSKMRT